MNSAYDEVVKVLRMNLGGVLHEAAREFVAHVVELAEKARTPMADLARYCYVDLGFAEFSVKSQTYAELCEVLDDRRKPIADAAWFLFSVKGFTPSWLRAWSGDSIRAYARVNGEAAFKMGLPVSPETIEARGSIHTFAGAVGSIVIERAHMDDGVAMVTSYYKRMNTADAAQFLAMDIGIGEYWLKSVGAQDIRTDAVEFRKMTKARQVEVIVSVLTLGNSSGGGYIDLKFFKGDVKVGEARISGKTNSPYKRSVILSDNFDTYRVESTPSARFAIDRVRK